MIPADVEIVGFLPGTSNPQEKDCAAETPRGNLLPDSPLVFVYSFVSANDWT